jgi:hypothetical protein
MNPDRPDLPCPWCRGRCRHVLGCPSPPLSDTRWDRQKRAHAAAVAFGVSEYGVQLMHLVEDAEVVRDARSLLGI